MIGEAELAEIEKRAAKLGALAIILEIHRRQPGARLVLAMAEQVDLVRADIARMAKESREAARQAGAPACREVA